MAKTILITGGLGFIGSNLVLDLLKATNYHLLILDKETYAARLDTFSKLEQAAKRIIYIKGDVTDKKVVEQVVKKSSIIIHLAAETNASQSVAEPQLSMVTNVMGTTMLLDAAQKYGVERFIFISSSEVYGDQQDKIPMDEHHPLVPITPYAVSKLAGDRLAYSFFLTKKMPVVILRLFNAYGSRQHTEKMMPLFITRLLKNLPITLYHGGLQKRDWVYVDDHVRAIKLVLEIPIEKVSGETFNIGTGKSTSVVTIAKRILQELHRDKSLLIIHSASQRGTMGNVGISKKAKKILGWEPEISLERGIKQTVEWYKDNRDWWEKIQK